MHLYLVKPGFVKCPKCGKLCLPHTVCWNCGYYKENEVIDVMKKLTRKEKKKKEKEIAEQEREQEKSKSLTMEGLSRK